MKNICRKITLWLEQKQVDQLEILADKKNKSLRQTALDYVKEAIAQDSKMDDGENRSKTKHLEDNESFENYKLNVNQLNCNESNLKMAKIA